MTPVSIDSLKRGSYSDGSTALIADTIDGEQELLSVNLGSYGFRAPEGQVFVKDYSEHSGLPDALRAAGAAQVVGYVVFGPFRTRAVLMELAEEVRCRP